MSGQRLLSDMLKLNHRCAQAEAERYALKANHIADVSEMVRLRAENERLKVIEQKAIEQSETVQRDWLSPVEADAIKDENELLKEALEKQRDWAKAYPVEVFPEPDLKGVRAALELHGFTIDQVSASNFRWLLSRVTDTVDKALENGQAISKRAIFVCEICGTEWTETKPADKLSACSSGENCPRCDGKCRWDGEK